MAASEWRSLASRGAIRVAIDHPAMKATVTLEGEVVEALAEDLEASERSATAQA
jgi:hypothetical protein